MSINSIDYSSSVLGQSIRNINQQLTDLSAQLSTGKLSQNYSGMGTNEGFAIAARSQISNIDAYSSTMTNVGVNINLENTALQTLTRSATRCRPLQQVRRRISITTGRRSRKTPRRPSSPRWWAC